MERGSVVTFVLLLACVLAVPAAAAPGPLAPDTPNAQAPGPADAVAPVAATLDDVSFMSGHWTGGEGGDLSEEVWTAPEGDSMMGMWRYVAGGKVRIFELLALTAEGPNVVLRIRHFDPKFVGREEKDRAVALPLVAKGPAEAVFEGPEYGVQGTVRLTYRRGEGETLTSVLEKGGKKQEFHFRRKR
jgi:hypothetical protein